jgi:hypothetical protein
LHWLNREDHNRCAYEQRPFQGRFDEILRADQTWVFCEALEFPSQAELITCEMNRLTFQGSKVLNEPMILTAVPSPLE